MPRLAECGAASREALLLWRQIVLWACALLPFGVTLAALQAVVREGWFSHKSPASPFILYVLLALLAVAFCWFRLAMRTRRPGLLAGIFVVALSFAFFRADWIVVTRYDDMGRESLATHAPPQSPLWRAPVAASWRACFSGGNSSGPIGEPWLEVNWFALTGRLFLHTALAFAIFSFAFAMDERERRRRGKLRHSEDDVFNLQSPL